MELVVATYKAKLDWIPAVLEQLPGTKLHLYCKGNKTNDPRCIHMENVGTEEFAYFKHILDRWDSLPDITIFSIDNLESDVNYKPTNRECLEHVVDGLRTPEARAEFSGFLARAYFPVTGNFDIMQYHASSGEAAGPLCAPSVRPYGKWYLKYINPADSTLKHLECTTASMHGIFAVSASRIRSIPKERYMALQEEVERCRGNNAFVAGHFMERSWAPLFETQCHTAEAYANLHATSEIVAHLHATSSPR